MRRRVYCNDKIMQVLKQVTELRLGDCEVVYRDSLGSIWIDDASIRQVEPFGYIAYFAIPQNSEILGYLQIHCTEE